MFSKSVFPGAQPNAKRFRRQNKNYIPRPYRVTDSGGLSALGNANVTIDLGPVPLLSVGYDTNFPDTPVLSWTGFVSGFQLEAARMLRPLAWSNAVETLMQSGGKVIVPLTSTNAESYFRLRKP